MRGLPSMRSDELRNCPLKLKTSTPLYVAYSPGPACPFVRLDLANAENKKLRADLRLFQPEGSRYIGTCCGCGRGIYESKQLDNSQI